MVRAATALFDALRSIDRVLDVGRRADIDRLPFADASFDVVVCRQRLQLLPDRTRALGEVRRVLVRGGRVALTVGGPIERSPAFVALADALERHAGAHAAATVRRLFSLPNLEDLEASLASVDFADIRVAAVQATASLPSTAQMLRFVPRSGASHTEPTRSRVIAELERELAPWTGPEGLQVSVEVHTAVGRR